MNRDEIMFGVIECVAHALDMGPSEIRGESRLVDDLGGDSLDLLDMIFQLEQRFAVKISPRGIERRAQAQLGDTPLEIDGVYTPEAVEKLREALPEIPPEELRDGLEASQLPGLFRVATLVNLVERLLEEQGE